MKHTIKLLTLAFMLATILTLTGCPGPVNTIEPPVWDDGVVTTEPTCTEEGVKTYTCSNGETRTETIPALGHDMGEWEITKNPTCTEKGSKTRKCSRCGETETAEIDALGHDYENWIITKEATCTKDGEKKHTCKREGCGQFETEVIPAAHDYQGGYCEREGCTDPWQYANHITIKVFTSESYFRTFYGLVNRLTTNSSNKEQTYKEVNFSFNSTPNMTANELIQLKNDYANYQVKLYYYSGSSWSDNDSIDITNDLLGVLIVPKIE